MQNKKIVLDSNKLKDAIKHLTEEIINKFDNINNVVLLGIQTRGVPLVDRIAVLVHNIKGVRPPVGWLDITLYRDDLSLIGPHPVVKTTQILEDITDKNVVLVDDVLFTGRTVRAALDEIMDFGRPKRVCLAVLVDRGGRELPVQADFVGNIVEAGNDEFVEVHLKEVDGIDEVVVINRNET